MTVPKFQKELDATKRTAERDRARFYNVVDRNVDGIIILDEEGIIKYINPSALNMFGRNIADLLGEEFGIPIKGRYTTTLRFINAVTRAELFAEMRVADIEWSGQTAYLASLRDVTERKKAEEALKKAKAEIEDWNRELEKKVEERTMELKRANALLVQSEKLSSTGLIAAGVAHELNNPLAGLLGLLRAYKEERKDDHKEHRNILLMLRAAEHMASIVRGLTYFARESNDAFTAVHLIDVVENTLSFIEGILARNKIKIIKKHGDNIADIYGNNIHLQQVVLNIITNARDAMPEGGEIVIEIKNSPNGSGVIMEFTDTGTGIAKENILKIFDPFFTTKEEGKGTGLGLSIVHGIIKSHNGLINIESPIGNDTKQIKGTKVTITFPKIADSGEERRILD